MIRLRPSAASSRMFPLSRKRLASSVSPRSMSTSRLRALSHWALRLISSSMWGGASSRGAKRRSFSAEGVRVSSFQIIRSVPEFDVSGITHSRRLVNRLKSNS